MEFQKGPIPVTEAYRKYVAQILSGSRVAGSGYFSSSGNFDIVRLGEKTEIYNTSPMWALNLLRFTEAEHGVWATREGLLQVFGNRMRRRVGERIEPVHTMDPANARFVDTSSSFLANVPKSGWLFNRYSASLLDEELTKERMEEILVNAEAGIRPPFFVESNKIIKVEPGSEGKMVQVIRFYDINDAVVVDIMGRCLLGRSTENILSQEKWEPK